MLLAPVALFFWQRHKHNAELRSHSISVGKNLHHLSWGCAGGDVVVRGLALQQKIAHASARQVGLKAVLAEGLDDRDGKIPDMTDGISKLF